MSAIIYYEDGKCKVQGSLKEVAEVRLKFINDAIRKYYKNKRKQQSIQLETLGKMIKKDKDNIRSKLEKSLEMKQV